MIARYKDKLLTDILSTGMLTGARQTCARHVVLEVEARGAREAQRGRYRGDTEGLNPLFFTAPPSTIHPAPYTQNPCYEGIFGSKFRCLGFGVETCARHVVLEVEACGAPEAPRGGYRGGPIYSTNSYQMLFYND